MNHKTIAYIIDFLTKGSSSYVFYGKPEQAGADIKVIIEQSNFWADGIYGTEKSLLKEHLSLFKNIPILYGKPKLTKLSSGQMMLHADIIASSYFLLSRYEEFVRKDCRDAHGRFLGKESIVFKAGYAQCPLVDEYGLLLRNLLREAGVVIPPEREGFSKVYLTHDVDEPFKYPSIRSVIKQSIKNIIKWNAGETYSSKPLHKYFMVSDDEYFTFPKLIEYDLAFKKELDNITVENIYFIITAGSAFNRKYYNFRSSKVKELLSYLSNSGATLGLHISYEGGGNLSLIAKEAQKLQAFLQAKVSKIFYSRHHFLRWCEPDDIGFMHQGGITDDFTLAYADYAGFRCGTSRSYRFINPSTEELTDITIHPLTIMECTLDRPEYMGLEYENAFEYCKVMIDQVYKHNGEIVLLWHNTEFVGYNYQEKLYTTVLEYIAGK